ncbi:MAG: hypothetical protein ACM3PZ_02055 [Bacillota bacterium]
MTSLRNASIYILTAILLLAGILIFALKGRILGMVSTRVFGNEAIGEERPLQPDAGNLPDIQILADPSFKKLQDSVLYFDFNYVGKPVIDSALGATIQPPAWQPVYLGNNSPFVRPIEKEADKKIEKK